MHAHVVFPPKRKPFLRRVQLQGDFTINGAEFTKRTTQEQLNELSARARGTEKG